MIDNPQYADNDVDAIVERFDAAWRDGTVPAISEFLAHEQCRDWDAAPLHELLNELVMIDMEYRWRLAADHPSGLRNVIRDNDSDDGTDRHETPPRPRLDDYLARHPQLGPPERVSMELIASEYRTRHRWGDRPSHQEFLQRFPQRDRAVLQTLEKVDARLPRPSKIGRLRIRCPHCYASIHRDDAELGGDFTCTSCNGRFSLIGDDPRDGGCPGEVQRIGAFELLEPLGSGSFGTVWKSRDTQLDRMVAVKLPHHGLLDSVGREQFLREARAAAQLRHPNIVRVHEVGRDGGRLYIVTDIIGGASLADWLAQQRPMPRDAAEVCAKLADALEHAHANGVIHRDIKPSNIMLDGDGQPHLMDFGLAKREAAEITMTADGKIVGTPAYMPPEQAQGSAHDADRRSDIYSLGVILFELLTGERPFGGSTDVLLQRIVQEDAISPRRLSRGIPQDLETVCLKCLEKDRGRRYQTAADLRDDLRRFLRGEPVRAHPITKAGRMGRWCKRNPVVAALGATAGSLLVFLAIVGPLVAFRQTRLANRQAEARASEATAREEMRRQLYVADMNVALKAWEAADVRRVLELLGRHKPQPNQQDLRRFEWYYLWRLCQRSLTTPTLQHGLPVTLVAFSPDGTTFASVGEQLGHGYEIRLWDAFSANERHYLKLEEADVYSGTLSPSLETLALGYIDGTVKLLNVWTGELVKTLVGHDEQILSLSFSADGAKLATRSRNKVMLWDLATCTRQWTVKSGEGATETPPMWVAPLSFSPNGDVLAWGTTHGEVKICEASEGKVLATLQQHTQTVNSVAFSPDGKLLASGSVDQTVKVWNVDSAKPLHSLDGHEGFVFSVAFSADGKTLASGSLDNTVKFWDVLPGKEINSLKGHAGWVTSVAFSPAGNVLASGSDDRTVKLWNVARDNGQEVLEGHENFVWSVAFSPDSKVLASGSWDQTAKLWDVASGRIQNSLDGHAESVWSVAFAFDGKTLATGSGILHSRPRDGRIKLWNVATGELLRQSFQATATVRSVAFSSADDTILATGTEDGNVTIWDAVTMRPRKVFRGAHTFVNSVAFSPDGKTLASGGRDDLVRLWDVESGRHRDIESRAGWVFSVAFSPDGRTLASGNRDHTVRLWNTETAREQATLKGHAGWVMCVAFTPGGDTVISGDSNRTVKLWDVATGELRVTLSGHQGGVHSVAFSPDGTTLASGDYVHKVRLWRAATDKQVQAAGEWLNRCRKANACLLAVEPKSK